MGIMTIKISWSFGWNGVWLFFGKSQVRGPALPLLALLLTVVAHVVDWKWWVNGVISGCYVVAKFPSLTPRSLNGKNCLDDLPRPTVGVHALLNRHVPYDDCQFGDMTNVQSPQLILPLVIYSINGHFRNRFIGGTDSISFWPPF